MSNNELSLKAINDLLEEQFYIPAYQRGYRWTSRQVEDLLNDVLEFSQKEFKSAKEFYCLQPVVVRQTDDKWELIDGQQRLTTVYIILSYFNRRLTEEYRKQLFSIEYSTRPKSKAYLDEINEEDKDNNIDFYHIYESFVTIETWFKDKRHLENDIESVFLNKVKVIWYEVKEDIDPIEVFTRLNIGKIPLTNAELVKALFLRARNFGENADRSRLMQLKISQEWDDMERALQNDGLWYFLANQDAYDTRIEFILDLMAENFGYSDDIANDQFRTFIAFNRWFQEENPDLENAWMQIKYYFMQLDEWHSDRYLFHLLGFLIHQGVGVAELRAMSQTEETKAEFRASLRSRIFGLVFRRLEFEDYSDRTELESAITDQLSEWSYTSQSSLIRSALLLFNIASLIRNPAANLRFQFDKYKTEDWDLEHIKSVSSEMPLRPDDQKAWLINILEYFLDTRNHAEYSEKISNVPSRRVRVICDNASTALDSSPFDGQLFVRVYHATLRHFREAAESETEDSIANLALLDAYTNRSYQNAVFPIKRNRIIALDKEGAFVPLCTKNVFLKYYSKQVENMMFWTEQDRNFYLAAIVEMLGWFFAENHEVLR